MVLVPFYRGAVVFYSPFFIYSTLAMVLVPFYRGAVVFAWLHPELIEVSDEFSSPFIEERLYFKTLGETYGKTYCSRPLLSRSGCISNVLIMSINENYNVLVPFYRGAVVFYETKKHCKQSKTRFSSPFIEERLYLGVMEFTENTVVRFSSPFIEERLYFSPISTLFCFRIVLVPFYRGAVVF